MTTWPVPGSESAVVPGEGKPGSFWEDRGDRFHCGVDIYAPAMSEVLACETGEVIDVGIATSPDQVSYWDTTRYVLVKTRSNLYCRYAEFADVLVHIGDRVLEGQVIGHIGAVIRPHLVDSCSPLYVQRLKLEGHISMLHFEVYRLRPGYMRAYIGGNWFGSGRPEGILDPGPYLRDAVHGIENTDQK
jgi:murein DD-endopeptidase MepM/ murein hydrolase activator NlpD